MLYTVLLPYPYLMKLTFLIVLSLIELQVTLLIFWWFFSAETRFLVACCDTLSAYILSLNMALNMSVHSRTCYIWILVVLLAATKPSRNVEVLWYMQCSTKQSDICVRRICKKHNLNLILNLKSLKYTKNSWKMLEIPPSLFHIKK